MAWYDIGDDDLGWLSSTDGDDGLSWLFDGGDSGVLNSINSGLEGISNGAIEGGLNSIYSLGNSLPGNITLRPSTENLGSGYNLVMDENAPGYDNPLGFDANDPLPGLSYMEGGRGMSYDVNGGTVTAAGFVPEGSQYTFGDPNSWIHRPSITGQAGAVSQDNVVTARPGGGDRVSTAPGGTPVRPGTTPSGTNASGEKEKGFDWKSLLPLLLMAMASRSGGGGGGGSMAIPKFTADRKQTPYGSEQFPAGRRPGANAQRYFEPVQYKASGGIAQLAAGGQAFGGVQSGTQPASRAPLSLNQRIQQDFARLSQQNSQDALYRYLASTGYTPQQIAAAMPQYGAADLAREMTKARNMFAGFSPGHGTILDRNDQGQLVTNALRVGRSAYDYVPSVNPNAAVTVPAPAPAPGAAPPAPDTGTSPGFDTPAGIAGMTAKVQQTDYASDPNRRPGSGGLFFKPVEYTNMAAGGGIGSLMAAGGSPSRLLRGGGDGTSDGIPTTIHGADGRQSPAAVADGEFIVDARAVAEIGNGSTEAGARKLEAFVNRVHAERKRAQRGKPSKADALLNKVA